MLANPPFLQNSNEPRSAQSLKGFLSVLSELGGSKTLTNLPRRAQSARSRKGSLSVLSGLGGSKSLSGAQSSKGFLSVLRELGGALKRFSQWTCCFTANGLFYSQVMKTFRIALGILAIIPIALLANKLLYYPAVYDEDSLSTLVYLTIGVPILTLNFWAWEYPEIIEFYSFGREI